jgi:hypothetical protein
MKAAEDGHGQLQEEERTTSASPCDFPSYSWSQTHLPDMDFDSGVATCSVQTRLDPCCGPPCMFRRVSSHHYSRVRLIDDMRDLDTARRQEIGMCTTGRGMKVS